MCGIAGFARLDGGSLPEDTRTTLESMALALRPRGPDDIQYLELSGAALSFTRLSLVDPIGGRQPFVSRDGRVALAANGEIYNHEELRRELGEDIFRSRSDCEVLLHLYERDGTCFLDRVRGMFGIAVIDLRRQQIVLARDRIGLKPLFIYQAGKTLLFGSEVKALFKHPECPRELDWAGALAEQGLNASPMMPVGPPHDWFKGIGQIDPGTMRTFDMRDGSINTYRYWSMPEPLAAEDVGPDELISQTREILAQSVAECLIADAEVGLMLSGGVDSAGIGALADGRLHHTFSAMSPSTLINGDCDMARETAALLGVNHHEFSFGMNAYPSPDEWCRLLWLMESPLCGPEQYLKSEIYRGIRNIRPDMKAVLLGSGADELAGGYSRMLASGGDWFDFLNNMTDMSRRRALASRDAAMGIWWDGPRRLVSDHAVDALHEGGMGDPYDEFVQWKIRDWQQYNFWVEDRTASGNAVEARVPFLDHRLVEIFAKVPRAYRQTLFWDKRIIRDALKDVLPREVLTRPKIAFYEGDGVHYTHLMFARMLKANGYELLERATASPVAAQYLRLNELRSAIDEVCRGKASTHLEVILRLINLGLLEELTADNPDIKPSSSPPPLEIMEADREDLRREVFAGMTVGEKSVLRRADDILILADQDQKQSYVAIAGQLRFVIDHDEDAAWLSVFLGFDGLTPLDAVCSHAGVTVDEVTDLAEQSLMLGLVVDARSPG
jgi:asparagine synthase (glutamine-hydrolysing)